MKLSFFLLAAAFGLAGCNVIPSAQPDETRYFVLSAQPGRLGEPLDFARDKASLPTQTPTEGRLRIGLKAVVIADYLKNPNLAVRSGSNEVRYPPIAHWAEPIEAGVGRILLTTLAASPKVASVQSHPFSFESQRDEDISIEILQCEGSTAGGRPSARFSARFEIAPFGQNGAATVRKIFVAPARPWDGSDYGQLARLLSEDAADLGKEIVESLK